MNQQDSSPPSKGARHHLGTAVSLKAQPWRLLRSRLERPFMRNHPASIRQTLASKYGLIVEKKLLAVALLSWSSFYVFRDNHPSNYCRSVVGAMLLRCLLLCMTWEKIVEGPKSHGQGSRWERHEKFWHAMRRDELWLSFSFFAVLKNYPALPKLSLSLVADKR